LQKERKEEVVWCDSKRWMEEEELIGKCRKGVGVRKKRISVRGMPVQPAFIMQRDEKDKVKQNYILGEEDSPKGHHALREGKAHWEREARLKQILGLSVGRKNKEPGTNKKFKGRSSGHKDRPALRDLLEAERKEKF